MSADVTGSVLIDLRGAEYGDGYRRLGHMHAVPDGAKVIVTVQSSLVDLRVVELLHDHLGRVQYEIRCADPVAVSTWVRVLRSDNPHVELSNIFGAGTW